MSSSKIQYTDSEVTITVEGDVKVSAVEPDSPSEDTMWIAQVGCSPAFCLGNFRNERADVVYTLAGDDFRLPAQLRDSLRKLSGGRAHNYKLRALSIKNGSLSLRDHSKAHMGCVELKAWPLHFTAYGDKYEIDALLNDIEHSRRAKEHSIPDIDNAIDPESADLSAIVTRKDLKKKDGSKEYVLTRESRRERDGSRSESIFVTVFDEVQLCSKKPISHEGPGQQSVRLILREDGPRLTDFQAFKTMSTTQNRSMVMPVYPYDITGDHKGFVSDQIADVMDRLTGGRSHHYELESVPLQHDSQWLDDGLADGRATVREEWPITFKATGSDAFIDDLWNATAQAP